MSRALCRITTISVYDDGDNLGPADMDFQITVNGTVCNIGRFTKVEDVKTLLINRSFEIEMGNMIRIDFSVTDEEPHVWGMHDQVARRHFEIDPGTHSLPSLGHHVTAHENGVEATIRFDLLPVSKLTAGQEFGLRCLGDIPGNVWLDGNTVAGSVSLVSQVGGSYTGTAWRARKIAQEQFTFECLGNVVGPKWLDGNTVDGTVALAPQTGGRFTGTAWRVEELGDDRIRLECLGDVPGPKWLDGNTVDNSVSLTTSTSGMSGTVWKIS